MWMENRINGQPALLRSRRPTGARPAGLRRAYARPVSGRYNPGRYRGERLMSLRGRCRCCIFASESGRIMIVIAVLAMLIAAVRIWRFDRATDLRR